MVAIAITASASASRNPSKGRATALGKVCRSTGIQAMRPTATSQDRLPSRSRSTRRYSMRSLRVIARDLSHVLHFGVLPVFAMVVSSLLIEDSPWIDHYGLEAGIQGS